MRGAGGTKPPSPTMSPGGVGHLASGLFFNTDPLFFHSSCLSYHPKGVGAGEGGPRPGTMSQGTHWSAEHCAGRQEGGVPFWICFSLARQFGERHCPL